MNIAVLIKHVVDSTEVRFDKKTGELRLRGLPEKISDYDKHAIEAAVQLKSKMDAKVTAFCFGPKAAFKSLKEAVAMGADKGILIVHNQADQIFDPVLTAETLVKAIRRHGENDLLLCGAMTEDTTNRTIGPAIACMLGYNHIPNVISIDVLDEKKLITMSEIDGFEVEIESELPIVLSVSRKLNEPRLATKIQIMKVPMQKIVTLSPADIDISENLNSIARCEFEAFRPIIISRKRIIMEENSVVAVNDLFEKLKKEGVL